MFRWDTENELSFLVKINRVNALSPVKNIQRHTVRLKPFTDEYCPSARFVRTGGTRVEGNLSDISRTVRVARPKRLSARRTRNIFPASADGPVQQPPSPVRFCASNRYVFFLFSRSKTKRVRKASGNFGTPIVPRFMRPARGPRRSIRFEFDFQTVRSPSGFPAARGGCRESFAVTVASAGRPHREPYVCAATVSGAP